MTFRGLFKRSLSLSTVLVYLLPFICEANTSSRELEGLELRCCAAVEFPILYEDDTKKVSLFHFRKIRLPLKRPVLDH